MFTCGASNFSTMEDDKKAIDHPPPKPKPSKKPKNQNPYSSRGLDKFTMVLAELEAKREKIMAKTGMQGAAMIRFMYNNSQDWVPIIIKPKEKDTIQEATKINNDKIENKATTNKEIVLRKEKLKEEKKVDNNKNAKWCEWLKWRGSYNWILLVMVLILVCLAMFGRVFAICCVSIWWYVAPTMKERSIKKKEYVRRLSDKRLGSPRTRHGVIAKKG